MPTRLLREGILDSEAVCSLTFQAEVFYRRLMSVVDDFGRFDGRVSVLRSRLYPLQVDKVREADIPRWIAECEKAGLIALYSVSGKPYILFHKLGSPRAKESKYPDPPSTVTQPDSYHTSSSARVCLQMQTDENRREQTQADVPYSGSGSDSRRPPNPPQAGGEDLPSALPTKRRTKTDAPSPESIPIPQAIDTPDFRAAWADWLADRKARRKPLTNLAAAQQLGKLSALSPAKAAECLRDSIANGWTGIFPERYTDAPTKTSTPTKPSVVYDPIPPVPTGKSAPIPWHLKPNPPQTAEKSPKTGQGDEFEPASW